MAADPSKRGVETVKRLFDLAKEMGIAYSKLVIVVNRVRGQMQDTEWRGIADGLKTATGADIVVGLPEDDELARLAENSGNLWELAEGNAVAQKVNELLGTVMTGI